MLDNVLQAQGFNLPYWVVIVIVLGSIVDICQFLWILKRSFDSLKKRHYTNMYRQVQADVMQLLRSQKPQPPTLPPTSGVSP